MDLDQQPLSKTEAVANNVDKHLITPVSEDQRLQIVEATNSCVEKAGNIFSRHFSLLTIDFDLRGKCAGMYQVSGRKRRIRYNPWIFAKYYEESLINTVTHEVAHYVVDSIWGIRHVKPHGKEWRDTMFAMGVEPIVTGSYDLEGIPTRQYRRYSYQCDCRTHDLTSLRHRKIVEKGAIYRCQLCHSPLKQCAAR
ncbi:MAG: metallopeptidase (SprT family) [SAR92 clade bacterium]|uniref:Metallopeptidase (SprT family) n=1 Tax=SAR92 clade bacterium TaxID=2315479 RepID=A0A520MDC5_9GAMM|nr:MAG: metallopeptidase (SprT family) [SAR92 clade bacterium]